jgi:hypothetical protein|tara:strand:- start:220 stop:489 length:270 start_codon:yes stop_codon:yes gene_type:complete
MKKVKQDIRKLVSPQVLSSIEENKIPLTKDLGVLTKVRDGLIKCLKKRRLDVFDACIGFGEGGAENFLVEYIYKDKVVLLEGKVMDRYI